MKDFKVELRFPPSAAAMIGKSHIPDFTDKRIPPAAGDLVRVKGLTFVISSRIWDLDITPPTLYLELVDAPQKN
ncbi:MAG: hypothetical protein RSB07_18680 [Comamonas sp.]